MTTKIRYNNELLQQFCKENGINLTKNYSLEKVNSSTLIEAKCLLCENNVSKCFRNFVSNGGCYCKKHTEENKQIKKKETCLIKYGVENPLQSKEIMNKLQETNLIKYGNVCSLHNSEIEKKVKETNLNKYGSEYALQCEKVKEKQKQTNLIKYGTEFVSQLQEVKDKIKNTCLEKYGVNHPSKTQEIKTKHKQTNLKKYGVECNLQLEVCKEKIKNTCLEKYGTEYATQSEEVKTKIKKTCVEKYGVEYSSQTQQFKDKCKQTCLEKYGVEYSSQDPTISEKSSKNAYKAYDYIFPSGRVERIQGYENFMLNDLLQKEGILEDDIVVKRSDVPSVWYEDASKKKRRYFVDCFIKTQNRCIEAKSTWTAAKKKDCIYLKQQALKDVGYLCEIWVYDGKGELVEKIC
jgi:hypothetical protein